MANMADPEFADILKQDYEFMLKNIKLRTSDRAKQLILMQSCQGHANNGDNIFRNFGQRYPEVAIEDIVFGLGECTVEVRKERQVYIDDMLDFADRLMSGEDVKTYTNRDGEPLFSIPFLKNIEIKDKAAVLIGMYLGSRMDRYVGWRHEAEKIYGVEIGGGECIGINRKLASEEGFTLEEIAREDHFQAEIEWMLEKGILCCDVNATKDIVSGYVRRKQGKGTSDDLSVILAGVRYGYDAALGLYLTDADDTWDKYVPFIHKNGQDEQLGDKIYQEQANIKKNIPDFKLPTKDEVYKFISLIAEGNYHGIGGMISCSQRYFLQVDKKESISTIESHLEYVKGKRVAEMHIGHPGSNMTNHGLYNRFERRFKKIYGS